MGDRDAYERMPKSVLLLAVVLVLAVGIYWIGKGQLVKENKKEEVKQEDVVIAPLPFKLSKTPNVVPLTKGKGSVKITVKPEGNFAETLSFSVTDLLQGVTSIKSKGIMSAQFSAASLSPANFPKGVTLSITLSPTAPKTLYVVEYTIKSPSVDRKFLLPVRVE